MIGERSAPEVAEEMSNPASEARLLSEELREELTCGTIVVLTV